MTLIEGFVKDEIFIDFGADVLYGSDQCNVSYPCRFPTVEFQLMATNGLSQIADRIRKDLGFAPMHPMDEYTDDTCDNDGWYDFYVGINGYAENHMDSCIEFVVVNSDSPDNEERYSIDLNEEEQDAMFKCLDAQCQKYLEKTCLDLLDEAETEMSDPDRYDLKYDLKDMIEIDPDRWTSLEYYEDGVQFKLKPTDSLIEAAKEVVKANVWGAVGLILDLADEDEDPGRLYDFYVTIKYDEWYGYHANDAIDFIVVKNGKACYDDAFSIYIKEDQAKRLYHLINMQVIDYLGCSANELLDEVIKRRKIIQQTGAEEDYR